MQVDLVTVTLADEPALPGDDEGRGETGGIGEGRVEGALHLGGVDASGQRTRGQHIAHGPGLRLRIRKLLLHDDGLEVHRLLARGKNDGTLIAEKFRGAHGPVRQGNVDLLVDAIHDRLAELRALRGGRREVAEVLDGKVGIETGDEHGRAYDLCESRGVMRQRVAGRRHIGGGKLEGLGPGAQRFIRRRRHRRHAGAAGRGRGLGRRRAAPRQDRHCNHTEESNFHGETKRTRGIERGHGANLKSPREGSKAGIISGLV